MIARNNHHRGLTRRWEEPSTASTPEVRVVDDDAVHFVWFVHNAN
jgi:hypothetical protein